MKESLFVQQLSQWKDLFLRTLLINDHERVFTAGIRKEGNALPIRGPGGVAFHHTRGLRQIANVTFLGWHREDVAAGFEYDSRTGGRNVATVNGFARFLIMWTYFWQVSKDRHTEWGRSLLLGIKNVYSPGLFVGQRIPC